MSTSVTPGTAAQADWPRNVSGGGAGGGAENGGDGGSGDGAPARRAGKLGYILIGLLVAVAAGGWAIIMGHANNTPGIAAQTITYKVVDDSTVQVRYAVAKAEADVVRCTVDAFDTDFAIVATSTVTVPAGTENLSRTDTLQTTRRATGARVKDCRKV
ncbi:DUF4307 domain-containing protein [Spirillospora sp. NPDC029432]|uniref:DUF4307 domain-containing protein n=1 Tax=Spirillospora sp. NPDC029432 TaxID=3154599 RepID=UPI003456823E